MIMQFWKSGKSGLGEDAEGGAVPEEWLDVDIKQGISNSQVEERRKRFGWNEITTEKENLFIKFLMFFTGPILYGESTRPVERTETPSKLCARNASCEPALLFFFSSYAGRCGAVGRKMAWRTLKLRLL